MCLAVPGEIKELLPDGDAVVDFMGLRKKVSLDLVEGVRVGDYVIVHAGFAINKLERQEALESIRLFREIGESAG